MAEFIAFLVGCFVGGLFGVLVMALAVASQRGRGGEE